MPASDYRLAPLQLARFIGGLMVVLALLVFGGTLAIALLDLSGLVLVGAVAVVLVAVVGVVVWLLSVIVVHFDDDGYRVRLVRGAGVSRATWRDVAEATTTTVAGAPVVVLTLKDQTTTTIPVSVLATDREEFVRDLQRRLQSGQGLRPLS